MTTDFVLLNIGILLIFTLLYEFLYRWNKAFLKNRLFLISAVVFSAIIPFINIKLFPYERIITKRNRMPDSLGFLPEISTTIDWLSYMYIGIVAVFLLLFVFRLVKIYGKINTTDFDQSEGSLIIKEQQKSFSFFHYIYLAEFAGDIEITHELIHANKLHSLDKILMELLTCFLWFNPLIYRIRYYIAENHEFEADELTIITNRVDNYTLANYLLENYKTNVNPTLVLTNEFHSLTKNRIMMLSKKNFKSKLIYSLMIPIFIGVFSSFTFKTYPVDVMPDGTEIVLDTVPGDIVTNIDTVVTYDYETYVETVELVKNLMPLDEYLKAIKLSGKTEVVMDTIVAFDSSTFVESLEVHAKTIPVEFLHVFGRISIEQENALIEEYGKVKITKIK